MSSQQSQKEERKCNFLKSQHFYLHRYNFIIFLIKIVGFDQTGLALDKERGNDEDTFSERAIDVPEANRDEPQKQPKSKESHNANLKPKLLQLIR